MSAEQAQEKQTEYNDNLARMLKTANPEDVEKKIAKMKEDSLLEAPEISAKEKKRIMKLRELSRI